MRCLHQNLGKMYSLRCLVYLCRSNRVLLLISTLSDISSMVFLCAELPGNSIITKYMAVPAIVYGFLPSVMLKLDKLSAVVFPA